MQVDSFVLRNPPERKARNRWAEMPRFARHFCPMLRGLHPLLGSCLRFASDTSPNKAFTKLQKNLSLRSDFL
ncbi:MAG: hypothetical protein SFU27_00235 [Thermonemataceae bacterium]|nr:hypothetical protein [Thermonemataceae bacterium]